MAGNIRQVTAADLQEARMTSTLNLADRRLTVLPAEVVQLTNLHTLDLGVNQLTVLPAEVVQLTNLHTLDLQGNRLTVLPAEIGQLTNLHTLDLQGNRLTVLPAEIGQLTNLQRLSLTANQLTALPAEIGQLTNLHTLDLYANQLTVLPAEVVQLTHLQRLSLGANQLTALPAEMGQLTNLHTLDLGANQLTVLPAEVVQLTHLHTLYLQGNQLTVLPAEMGQLTHLQRLSLGANQLTALPAEVGQLTNLHTLDVGANQLTALPAEMGQLTHLHTLSLGANQLTALPAEVGQLTNLHTLDLEGNQLTVLPAELAEPLACGLSLKLEYNPLDEPLPELVARGADALTTYLRSLEDAIPQYEAKVLLVGEGNVGKTSLVDALREEPFVPDRPTTHGIEIRLLTLPHPTKNVALTLRAWDFGGQEVYRITHQFFFSRRALYLVVWNAREGQEQNEVEGWLRRIRLRVGRDAPTLVVATHCDERNPELDYPRLQQLFAGMLVGRHQVDNSSRNGIPELRNAIADQAAWLPQMGQQLSPRWIAAREEILARGKQEPQISYEEFVVICERHQVVGEEISTLAELLHDFGQIIYYGDDEGLRDIVVLNPEWLTKAIGYVLEDTPTRERDGILDHARLNKIWQQRPNGAGYPARYYPYFLRLMEKFDVSYRLEHDQHASLVAQLVPHERPDLPWDSRSPTPESVRTLALVCQLSEPAPGLVAWLTVHHHRASTGRHWRSGVFLRHPIDLYDSEALLELRDDRHLAVEVRAPSPDLFFNVLRDSVEDLITRRWPGVDYQLLIPCPTQDAAGTACVGEFKLGNLLRFRERGKTDITCLECGEDLDIGALLTGFALPPVQPELEWLQEQLSDLAGGVDRVASGVDRLERYAADTANSVRRVLKAVSSEVTDCPRLFTLTPEQATGWRRLQTSYQDGYQLLLWCEHSGHWHPWPAATYHLRQPKEWLARIGPYATLVVKTLQLVVPIAGAVAGVALPEEQLKHAQHELELMKTLIGKLPTKIAGEHLDLDSREPNAQLTVAEGEALRGMRAVLFDQDRARSFGDLRRVQAPSGEFLWVCTNHYPEYDPGLPSIPGVEQMGENRQGA